MGTLIHSDVRYLKTIQLSKTRAAETQVSLHFLTTESDSHTCHRSLSQRFAQSIPAMHCLQKLESVFGIPWYSTIATDTRLPHAKSSLPGGFQ